MEKKCLAFVKRLSKRLSEGLADSIFEDLDQTSIEEAFTDAISSLPKGDLKEALLNNTKLYQEKFLKKLQKSKSAKNTSTNDKPSSKADVLPNKKYPYNFIRKNRYRIDPGAFSCLSREQKCATYGHYLQNLLRFTSEKRVMHTFVEETEAHKAWLQELKESSFSGKPWGKDIESLLQIMSSHKNLNSIITVMKILLSKSQKEMDHLVQKKELKRATELAERLKKFLIVFHLKKKVSQSVSSEPEKSYVNLMSSLLSIFIDMTVLNSREEERKKKIGRYICGFTNYLLSPWPHSRLDVLLQISVLDEEDSEILMPFVRSVFTSSLKQDNFSTHETYLKHVLAVKFLSQKFQKEMAEIVGVTRGKRASDGFLDWLQERCPDVLEEMPVNDKKFKGKQITNFIIDEADEEMVSKLLDTLTEDTVFSPERVTVEETWKSNKDEGEETELEAKTDADLFFLDTKGFEKVLIRDTEVSSEDENQDDDEVHIMKEEDESWKEKENEAEENMEERSDQPPEDADIFFLDTKGSKKVLDARHKSETCVNSPSPVKPKSPKKKSVGECDQQLVINNEAGDDESPRTKQKRTNIPSPVKSPKRKRDGEGDQQLVMDNEVGNIESPKTRKKRINIPSPVKSKLPKKKRVEESDQQLVLDNEAGNIENKPTSPKKRKTRNNDQQILDQSLLVPEAIKHSENTITMGYVSAAFHAKKENILLVPDLSVFLKSKLCSPSRLSPRDGKEMLSTRQKEKNDMSSPDSVVIESESESESQLEVNVVKSNKKVRQDTVHNKGSETISNKMSSSKTLTPMSKSCVSCDADTSTAKPRNKSISQSKNSKELLENKTPASMARSSRRRTPSATKQAPSTTCLSRGNRRKDKDRDEEDIDDKGISDQKLATPSSIILLNEGESSLDSFTQLIEHKTQAKSVTDTDVNTLSFDHLSCLPMTMKEGQTLGHMRRMSLRHKFQDKDFNSEGLNVKGFLLEGHSEKTTLASLSKSRTRTTSESSNSSRISTRSMTSRMRKGRKSLVEKEVYLATIQPDADDPEIHFSHIPAIQKNQAQDKDFKKSPSREKSPKKGYSLRKK
ncbi:hypothetical protein CHS0354_034715 [Potamilus streckersoni]|uniref:Uncharacterized protein n=1 Tax=Potamilus streckersoni TaxID=2493646 RepID=A0AAE0SJ31_9BIVA|nr:hypothetical protein CHS0354_034715 [Potamilus streckersoni]